MLIECSLDQCSWSRQHIAVSKVSVGKSVNLVVSETVDMIGHRCSMLARGQTKSRQLTANVRNARWSKYTGEAPPSRAWRRPMMVTAVGVLSAQHT